MHNTNDSLFTLPEDYKDKDGKAQNQFSFNGLFNDEATQLLHGFMKNLEVMGWHCLTIWECELKPSRRRQTLETLLNSLSRINLSNNRIRTYEIGEDDVRIMVAEEMEPYK